MTENNAAQPGENLLDYAMAIAHERELDVTGHKHDSDGAVRRFKAAVERALLSKLRAEGVQAGDERTGIAAMSIPVPFSVDTSHKNQAFVTLGFSDEDLRKAFVRAVCHGGFRVPEVEAAPTDDALLQLARSMPLHPWGVGSQSNDAVYFARAVLSKYRAPLASAPVAGEAKPEAKYQRMFVAACEALAAINEKLGLDPNDGEPDAIISAIDELMGHAKVAAPQASEAVRWVVTDDMRAAVRFAPSSAHWSERLKEFFGPDAREGINALEKQLREARAELDRQQRASEAVRNAEPVAYCQPDDPINSSAFSWPGMGRKKAHTTPLYAGPQADKYGGDCAKGAGYAGVTVWIGDRKATQVVTKQILASSNTDELLYRFHVARAALSPTQPTEQGECDE